MSLKLVLADAQVMCRQGLCRLLQQEPDITVVGQAGTSRQLFDLIGQTQPDVLVFDPALPEVSLREFVTMLKARHPSMKITAMVPQVDVGLTQTLLNAGVHAVVLKACEFEHLRHALEQIKLGRTYLCPQLAEAMASGDGRRSPAQQLSQRERQVLDLVAQGFSTKEIAGQLHLSVKTVDTHRQHIMDKLKIRGIADLTRFAIREGITPLT